MSPTCGTKIGGGLWETTTVDDECTSSLELWFELLVASVILGYFKLILENQLIRFEALDW